MSGRDLFRPSWLATLVMTLLLPSTLAAQGPVYSTFAGLGAGAMDYDRQVAGFTREYSGTTLTGEGRLSFWRLFLDVRYVEGELDNDTDDTSLRLVEAEALLGIRPIPWISLQFGPTIRKIEVDGGTESVSFWEARALAEAALIAPIVSGYFGAGYAAFADSDEVENFDSRIGADAGLVLRAGELPILARLGYRISHATFESEILEETVQQFFFVVGVELGW